MKLRHFKAERYRSLKSLELDVDDFLVLIGENNHGKSNIFYALQLFLSGSSKGITKEDFYNRETDQPIKLTARFENLSEQELQKLRPWTVRDQLTVTKEYAIDNAGKLKVSYLAEMSVPEDNWLHEDFQYYNDRGVVSNLPLYHHLPQTGRISREDYSKAVRTYVEGNRSNVRYKTEVRKNPAGFNQVLDSYLPELYLVPAVRDVSDETKTATASTLLGRLVGAVIERIAHNNPSFQQVTVSLQNVKSMIEGVTPDQKMIEIKELERDIGNELSAWKVSINIGVDAPDPRTIFAMGTRITINDGLATDISQKGHGLQRALLFALIRIWASSIRRSSEEGKSSIFAFEEPELFLHPQVSRVTYDALRQISEVDQVLICSHSPHFINLEDYKSIAIIRKPSLEKGTKCFRVKSDIFQAGSEDSKQFKVIQFFNPDRNELFFARKVVLTEGATEKAVLPLIAKRIGVFDHKISIIDCNSKFNLPLYMKVLNAFSLPYLVLHDEDPVDPELQLGGAKHDPQKLKEANRIYSYNRIISSMENPLLGKVHMASPNFDSLLQLSRSRIESSGKPYAAAEKYLDERTPVPRSVEEIVRLVFS